MRKYPNTHKLYLIRFLFNNSPTLLSNAKGFGTLIEQDFGSVKISAALSVLIIIIDNFCQQPFCP